MLEYVVCVCVDDLWGILCNWYVEIACIFRSWKCRPRRPESTDTQSATLSPSISSPGRSSRISCLLLTIVTWVNYDVLWISHARLFVIYVGVWSQYSRNLDFVGCLLAWLSTFFYSFRFLRWCAPITSSLTCPTMDLWVTSPLTLGSVIAFVSFFPLFLQHLYLYVDSHGVGRVRYVSKETSL